MSVADDSSGVIAGSCVQGDLKNGKRFFFFLVFFVVTSYLAVNGQFCVFNYPTMPQPSYKQNFIFCFLFALNFLFSDVNSTFLIDFAFLFLF